MKRSDIINLLIKKYQFKTYLEIGVQYPDNNFEKIIAPHKFSVDPFPVSDVSFIGTSDEFFDKLSKDEKFDIVFIDGLHHSDQVLRDINNSLSHLTDHGIIICHDCLPSTEIMQQREDNGAEWTGDVWKAIAELRVNTTDLEIFVVDCDYGCGIIKRGTNIPYLPSSKNYKTYAYFQSNKQEMMNIYTVDKFLTYIENE